MADSFSTPAKNTQSGRILVLVTILNFVLLVLSTAIIANGKLESMVLANTLTVQLMTILTFCLLRTHTGNVGYTTIRKGQIRKCIPKSIFTRSPGLLALWWIVPTGIGLMLSSRQPLCLPASSGQSSWQKGYTCYLHRTMVGLSVVMLVALCTLVYSLERPTRQKRLTLAEHETGSTPKSMHSTSTSAASHISPLEDQLYLIPESHPSIVEREQWLQRRNSLSSRKAIYPHHQRMYIQPRCKRTRSIPSRLHSLSETSELTDMCSNNTWSTAGGISNSSSDSSYNSVSYTSTPGSRKSVSMQSQRPSERLGRTSSISHMQSAEWSNPDQERIPSPPPPTWCPSLKQVPLSSDPAIRALSAGKLDDGTRLNATSQTQTRTTVNTPPSTSLARTQTAPNLATSSNTTAQTARTTHHFPSTRSLSETPPSRNPIRPTAPPPAPATWQPYPPPPPPPPVTFPQRPRPTRIPSKHIYQTHRRQKPSVYRVMPPTSVGSGVLRDRSCNSAVVPREGVSGVAAAGRKRASSVYSVNSGVNGV